MNSSGTIKGFPFELVVFVKAYAVPVSLILKVSIRGTQKKSNLSHKQYRII